MKFKEVKEEIIKRCENNNACTEELQRVKDSRNRLQLAQIFKDNFVWAYGRILNVNDLRSLIGESNLNKFHVYTQGKHKIVIESGDSVFIYALGSSSATVETWDSSSATVKTWDSSSATVETWDSSSATVETSGSSSATVKTWDSSSATYTLEGRLSTIKDLSKKVVLIGDGLRVSQ